MVSLVGGTLVRAFVEPSAARHALRAAIPRQAGLTIVSGSHGLTKRTFFRGGAALTGTNGLIGPLPWVFVDGARFKCYDLGDADPAFEGRPAGFRLAMAA